MPNKEINSHIIPRHHLKQFTNDYGCIFTYPDPDNYQDNHCKSKGGGSIAKNTASKIGYYSEEIEKILDNKFENQGSKIAKKILERKLITPDEREFFAKYIASFLYRVPASQKMLERLYPQILKQKNSVEYYLKNYYGKANPNTYYKALNDPAQKEKRINFVWENSIKSEHNLVYNALLSREWWIAEVGTNSSEYFITSDNPVFYSTKSGMADRDIQITFPLSQRMAMVFDGNRETPRNSDIEYCSAGRFIHNQVDLINKRTANNSTYLYSPKHDINIQSLVGYRVTSPDYIKRKL